MYTFYDCKTAPSPRRARILLAEKGVGHTTVNVDLARGEQLTDAYRRINPACTVPALQVDDRTVLADNAGIAAYLEARYPEPALMGTTPAEKADIASWNWRAEFDGLMAIAEAFRNSSPAMANRALPGPTDLAQIPALAERGMQRLRVFLDLLDHRLSNRDFVAGNGFSIADVTAVVTVDFARIVRYKPGPEHGNIVRWRTALAARPSIGPPSQ